MTAVKLALSPALQLHGGSDTASLVSESEQFDLPIAYMPLLKQLQSPTDIDEIAADHRPYLKHLGELRLLHGSSFAGLDRSVAAYWLSQGFPPNFASAQLALSIQFSGHQSARYRELMAARHPDATVCESGGLLAAYVTKDLLECELPAKVKTPIVLIKVGGVKQSIGPVLSPAFGYADLVRRIKRPFDADLSVPVPAGIQTAADALLLTELYHLRVRAAAHPATSHVVEWNLTTLTKTAWKVKQ